MMKYKDTVEVFLLQTLFLRDTTFAFDMSTLAIACRMGPGWISTVRLAPRNPAWLIRELLYGYTTDLIRSLHIIIWSPKNDKISRVKC